MCPSGNEGTSRIALALKPLTKVCDQSAPQVNRFPDAEMAQTWPIVIAGPHLPIYGASVVALLGKFHRILNVQTLTRKTQCTANRKQVISWFEEASAF